jgi:hypothetical protein
MTTVETVGRIRRAHFVQKLSVREIARGRLRFSRAGLSRRRQSTKPVARPTLFRIPRNQAHCGLPERHPATVRWPTPWLM